MALLSPTPLPAQSILFERPEDAATLTHDEPPFFADLHLDQVATALTTGREEYDLAPIFYTPLPNADAVRYRQEILRDLERDAVHACATAFAQRMRLARQHHAQADDLHHPYQKKRWFVDAAVVYGDAVSALARDLAGLELRSRGLRALRDYLSAYAASGAFTALLAEARAVLRDLGDVHYSIQIRGSRVTISPYDGEPDYSAEVQHTFAKFQQGAVKDYVVTYSEWPQMDTVEERVLDLVARLYPAAFRALDAFCARHQDYLDSTVSAFDREVQFYLAYLDFLAPLKEAGLRFSYPRISAEDKAESARDTFDLALANVLVLQRAPVVCNDFTLQGPERVIVVTGPNQGGKTTFARLFGQMHYLASLGYPVPGSDARLFLASQIFTHFEREEDLATLRGKLEDELVRIHAILERATSASVIIMNESFAATTLHDAVFLGTRVLRQVIALDALCLYVTFVDELAALGPTVVSMVSTVAPDNPALRTYKIIRQPANGLAFAVAIAEKYGVTEDALRQRLAQRGITARSDLP